MATAGARAQKPVGSAAWISTEKENITQLVNQEIEEIEYPVRHEMDWLNEHMAEVFSNNQFNFAEVFKTPGKLRGKTPRTVRKRNVNENRVPLSEIFASAHKDNESNAGPARSPTKPIVAPIANTAPTPKAKETSENTSHPQYPDLSKNLNSFPKYNTDSGYHGMPDDEEEEGDDDDDDMILTQVQPESQTSTQPLDNEPAPTDTPMHRSSIDRRTTVGSFHSAQEDVRQRGETVEPMNAETTPKQKTEEHSPRPQSKEKEPEVVSMSEPISEPVSEPVSEPEPIIPEPVRESSPEHASEPHFEPQSSPAKVPAAKHSDPLLEEKDDGKEDTALDNFDDIGSPSDGSTPERPTIRKSSLSFASLPAREPLMKKSLGGSRISRTSHIDIAKINAVGSGYLGRQTGGHRATQAALEANPTHDDKMDIDSDKESLHEDSETDTKASKLHNMSSTQRLHEKISMLGKLQPSRPTKSIPSVSGLSSAHVAYPELPTAKRDSKPEMSSQKSLEAPALEPMATDEDEWIKPLNSPQKSIPPKSQAIEVVEKHTIVEPSRASEKENSFASRNQNMDDGETARTSVRNAEESVRGKSATPIYSSSPQRPSHQKSASVSNTAPHSSTTPVGSPARQDGPLSASKLRLQSIMRSAKGLFTNSGSVSAAAKLEASSPDEPRTQSYNRANPNTARGNPERQPTQVCSPPRQEGRRTRSSTEREEKRKQKEREDRQREEEQAEKDREEEQAEKDREEERQRALQLKAAQEKSKVESEGRPTLISGPTAAPSQRAPQLPRPQSKEPEPNYETGSKVAAQAPVSQQQPKQNDRRPVKPTREALQKPKPQPVSIRVGSALSRQIPLASTAVSSSAAPEPSGPVAPPPSTSKQPTLKKKPSNSSLHTASSNSSFKSSVSSQTQRKTQLASERKREQDEREARRKEEQRREMERKRAAQQSRAEAERRERLAAEDPKKVAQMQAIEKRRQENARRLERQGSQQPSNGRASILQQERAAPQPARPASRLGSIQPFSRSINQPQPNPAKPPKRGLDDEANLRPAASQPGTVQPPGESKRRRTDDEQNPMSSIRPTMAPPIRQSGIRKESMKPSIFGHGQPSMHQSGSSIFKTAQPQKPAHPIEMAKYASGKIPFAEPSNPTSQPSGHKTPGASSSQMAPAKPSPHYPNGENIHLPEIATDSEDEDSDAEMLPVPKWAQPKELETILRQQEGMEADSIFGPIAPFSLEETFKADKKIKKFRDRTSSANWSGADGLTQEEIRKDLAERQRLRLNGGWTFGN